MLDSGKIYYIYVWLEDAFSALCEKLYNFVRNIFVCYLLQRKHVDWLDYAFLNE